MWMLLTGLALSVDVAWYADTDEDGFGDGGDVIVRPDNQPPPGRVSNATDCNDDDAAIFPGAAEACNGLDDDCDGVIDGEAACYYCFFSMFEDHSYAVCNYDEGDVLRTSWNNAAAFCLVGGYDLVTIGSNAEDAHVLDEVRSANAARQYWIGLTDQGSENTFYWVSGLGNSYRNWADNQPDDFFDEDCVTTNYGFAGRWNDTDCDDSRPFVCEAAGEPRDWWPDTDGDGFGDATAPPVRAHARPDGFVNNAADCNDGAASVAPGTAEVCNDIDDDCDGVADEGAVDRIEGYIDGDDDGFGSPSVVLACAGSPFFSDNDADCDDSNDQSYPGAPEVCNGADDNCNGRVDENPANGLRVYTDQDGDGFGVGEGTSVCAFVAPEGTATANGDCDDGDALVNPAAEEVCDGVDNDCVEGVDVGASDASTWYRDADEDQYGVDSDTRTECTSPEGYVADDGDCDDTNPAAYPGAPEVQDGVDNDCDGDIDDIDVDTEPDTEPDTDTGDPGTDTGDPDTGANGSSRRYDPTSDVVPAGTGCSCGASGAPMAPGLVLITLMGVTLARRRRR